MLKTVLRATPDATIPGRSRVGRNTARLWTYIRITLSLKADRRHPAGRGRRNHGPRILVVLFVVFPRREVAPGSPNSQDDGAAPCGMVDQRRPQQMPRRPCEEANRATLKIFRCSAGPRPHGVETPAHPGGLRRRYGILLSAIRQQEIMHPSKRRSNAAAGAAARKGRCRGA